MNLLLSLPTAPNWAPLEMALSLAGLPTELVLQFKCSGQQNGRHHFTAIDTRREIVVNHLGQPLVKTEWGMRAVPSIAPLLVEVLPPFCHACGCTQADVLYLAYQQGREWASPICCEVTI